MRQILFLLSISTLVVVLLGSHTPTRAAGTTPQLLAQIPLGDSTNDKAPSIATYKQTVHIGGSVSKNGTDNNTDAMVWTLAEEATSIGSGVSVGGSVGKPDYSTTSVATGPDGSVYAFWGSISEQALYLRRRDAAGNWGATYTVTTGNFPIFQQIAVDSAGKIYVVWQGVNVPLSFKYSSDYGASWSSTYMTSHAVYSTPPSIAIGPNNEVIVGLTTGDLAAGVAFWTGSGLATEVITVGGVAANTSAAYSPDGKIYAAWRGLDEGTGPESGVQYAERSIVHPYPWTRYQLVTGNVKGPVTTKMDSTGTLHIGWIAAVTGGLRFHYTYRYYGDQFVTAGMSGGLGIFNSDMDISSDGAFAHAALEDWSAGSPRIVYVRFSGSGSSFTATPVIANDAAAVGSEGTTQVKFVNVNGVTNLSDIQVRWHWNSAPTNADTWRPYTNPMTVDIPLDLRTTTNCTTSTLYTQLRDTKRGIIETPAKKDTVIVDGVLEGVSDLHNPYINITSSLNGTDSLASELALSKGASGGGDPNYTRIAMLYLRAQNAGDCSGISSVSIGKTADTLETSYKLVDGIYRGFIPLPDLANLETGDWPVVVQLKDAAGNVQNTTYDIVFDDVNPVLQSAGTPTTTPNPYGDVLQDISFSNVVVNDDYTQGSRHFWGVWLANSPTTVSDPVNSLNWITVPASGTGTSFVVKNWSLAAGLATPPTPSETSKNYYIYVRFLDGAGNPTALMSQPIVVSSKAQPVNTFLPFSVR